MKEEEPTGTTGRGDVLGVGSRSFEVQDTWWRIQREIRSLTSTGTTLSGERTKSVVVRSLGDKVRG